MSYGGKRAGAGRKKGSKNGRKLGAFRVRAAAARKLTTEGALPLEVMLTAMQRHLAAAQGETIENLDEYDKAAAIAKDAAPYIHPRLSQTQGEATVKEKIVVVRGGFLDRDNERQT